LELNLQDALPPESPDGISKGLAKSMVDMIAALGGFTGGAEAKAHWRSAKCASLHQVKNLGMSCKWVTVLLKLCGKVIKHTIIVLCNACEQDGWQDLEQIEAWANWVARNILSQHPPADCLMINRCNAEVWIPWMSSAPLDKWPTSILLFTQAIHLEKESGAASKMHHKSMEKLGCSIHFWPMEAGDFGSAASQLRLGVLCTQET
jgi:hypothetical protein